MIADFKLWIAELDIQHIRYFNPKSAIAFDLLLHYSKLD